MRALITKSTVLYLDADRRFSHSDKLLPLQPDSESPLQRDDAPENFSVEYGLQTLTLSLPQKHLRGGTMMGVSTG